VLHRFLHTGGPTTPRMILPYYLADNRRIVYMSEKTGFRQLHVLNPVYESDVPLTQGHFEVYPVDITEDHKWMFVTATKEHPARLDVYRVSLEDGTMTRLSKQNGYYSNVAVSQDGTRVLANFARFGAPRELVLIDDKSQKKLTDSHPPVAHELTKPRPEFFSYQNRHEQEIHGFMFKPEDPNMGEKPPLLIYIYGGPLGTRKSVVEGSYSPSAYFFAYYMTKEHGYVTCTIDPRGNSGYGGLFEKANFEQVGKPQVEDIVDGVKYLIENHNVDPNRVAIHGWSFGGFQTQMCLYTEPEVFAAGIAGAGPTEWENYNSWYTSGTIGISEPGSAELKKFSLLPLAKDLEAKLLLVHGMEDSNVLYQDTIRMYRELIKAGKETLVELFLDPTGGHGLGGDVKNLCRYRKYEEFLLRTVGSGK
jgi:dipeptidyl-peptidase-4